MEDSVANGQGQLIDYKGRLLNHMNLVHRPGERQLVSKLFTALGCEVRDTGEPYLFISIAPGNKDLLNNILFATEATPEQWRFEQELQRVLADDRPLAQAYAAFAKIFAPIPSEGPTLSSATHRLPSSRTRLLILKLSLRRSSRHVFRWLVYSALALLVRPPNK